MSKNCQICNAEMADSMNFCPYCKAKYVESISDNVNDTNIDNLPKKSRNTAKIIKKAVSIIGTILVLLFILFNNFKGPIYYNLGLNALDKKDFENGLQHIVLASKFDHEDAKLFIKELVSTNLKDGDPETVYMFGYHFFNGTAGLKKDEKLGRGLIHKAAKQGWWNAKIWVDLDRASKYDINDIKWK